MPAVSRRQFFPKNAIFVLGAGRFGSRAVRILGSRENRPIWIVDKEDKSLSTGEGLPLPIIQMDAFAFLSENFHLFRPDHMLVPSIPAHVAFEWLARTHAGRIRRENIPPGLSAALPNTCMASDASLLVSYADFVCPEDCPEPSDHCTVTRKKRATPLFDLLRKVEVPDYHTHVIRSRQLAPGVGGYRFGDLMGLLEQVGTSPQRKWLLGTACRCHGIITAFSL
jgi:hypothetical protein